MRTDHILLALSIARETSISKAAEAMNTTQSNASSMLRVLEKELGYAIFERTPSGVTLTGKGKVFIENAAQIEYYLQALYQLSEPIKPINLRIISISFDFSELAFKELCKKYCNKNYASKLSFKKVGNMEEIKRALEIGEADVAIGVCRKGLYDTMLRQAASMNMETEMICNRHLEVTCKKGHPIIAGGKITYSLFGKYPAFVSIQASSSDMYAPYFLTKHDIDINNLITLEPGPVRYELMNELDGFLVSMPIPEKTKEDYEFESVEIMGTEIAVFAQYRKGAVGNSLIQEYLEDCKELA
ncbi:MAG: LysR family transcriptional regulator [Parasporobacterium sp.]|nr:LysR family transcriptional regulator [Parasporobacterium sp.]